MAAVLAMPALLGKFGVRGGGYTMSNSPSIQVDASRLFRATAWTSRVINMTQLARVLGNGLEPPIKGLFVYNCNPAVTVPEQNAVLQALAQDDLFTVVFDQVMTDTARYADIVLPATTFLEHFDIRRSYGHYVVGGVRPVIEPVGEARSNAAVFAALGRAMGWEEEPFTWDDRKAVTKLAAALEVPGGAPAASDMLEGRTHAFGFEGANPVQGRTVHPRTPDGKIHLAPPALGESPFSYDPVVEARYPLALISPAGSRLVSSVFGEFNLAEMVVIMHPRDAARRRVAHGDVVRVFNGRGEVHCRAAVSDRLRPGVVSLPKGAWRRASRNGQTATALCPATVGVVGDGACFNDARVEVEPLGPLT